jgi:osmotically-inducible protein OsmY
MKPIPFPRTFLSVATLVLAGAASPVLAASASAHASASSSANGAPAQFSETIGIATPQKRIVGTTRATGAEGPVASDDRLLNQVVAALVRDPGMQGADIQVHVDGGQVTLDGKAKDSAQADHARQVAENVAGNGHVTSNLSASG